MKTKPRLKRSLTLALCLTLLAPLSASPQGQQKNRKRVQIQVGKPSVWSMGQAHYMLAGMRRENRGLRTPMPSAADLNPNAINASSIQILRTLLDVQAQFNQRIGIQNQAAMREQQFNLRRRDDSRLRLAEKQNELDEVNERVEALNLTLARLKKEDQQRKALSAENKTPQTDDDRLLELRIAGMEKTLEARQNEKAALQAEVTALETKANAAVAPPTLTDPELAAGATALPDSDALKAFIANAFKEQGKPSLAASIALDNFISMQYEIIAKQMTLLRDEIGLEDRIIFVELPSSIYTVPDKAEEYMVQVQWSVDSYVDIDEKEIRRREREGEPSQDEDLPIRFSEMERQWLGDEGDEGEDATEGPKSQSLDGNGRASSAFTFRSVETGRDKGRGAKDSFGPDSGDGEPGRGRPTKTAAKVRALDIIPRQSALNINEQHATINKKNFLGVLKLISGLGIQVGYQKQRELYDQFLQQNIFASGFGKGLSTFGWTFAPLPGTKRIAPGVRTTYAVLAVPANTSALEISVKGIAYKRKEAPDFGSGSEQIVTHDKFLVRVPNQYMEDFHVTSVDYTPVKKGNRVTAIIRGDYFSPQTGVLVNGVPLARALSIANNESANAEGTSTAVAGVQGDYEHLSTHEMLLNFAMGDTYVGTPTITLVTPEKSAPINFFNLRINQRRSRTSLQEHSLTEPMFMDAFGVEKKLDVVSTTPVKVEGAEAKFVTARLKGTGLRPSADIWIFNHKLPSLNELLSRRRREREALVSAALQTAAVQGKRAGYVAEATKTFQTGKVARTARQEAQLRQDRRNELTEGMMRKAREILREEGGQPTDAEVRRRAAELASEALLQEPHKSELRNQAASLVEEEIQRKAQGVADDRLREDAELAVTAELKAKYKLQICAEEGLADAQCNTAEVGQRAEARAKDYGFKPEPADEYVTQDSTGAYLVYFNSKGQAEWPVRFRQQTRQGFEGDEFVHAAAGAPVASAEIRRYVQEFNVNEALVDLRVKTTIPNPQFSLVSEMEGAVISQRLEEKNTYRVIVRVSDEKIDPQLFVKRDKITVSISSGGAAVKPLDITLPVRPDVLSIVNPRTGQGVGFADEEPIVTIRGTGLQGVKQVFFGEVEAKVVGTPSHNSIDVKVPKVAVAKGQSIMLPVRLVTETNRVVAVTFYTFLGEPQAAPPKS
jgi:hypothetical protein